MGLGDLFNKKKQSAQGSNDDEIISVIDELFSNAEYEKIIQKTEEIPSDKWSNELWFRRIDALNRLSRFKEAKKEISLLSKRCSEPKEDARLFNSMGYILDHTDCELKAVECFYKAQGFDPDLEGLKDAIDSSMERADQNLSEAKNTLEKLFSEISDLIGNAGEQNKINEDSAFSYISMIQASFIPYGIGIEIPLDKLFFKCDDADKPKMKSLLKEQYGITDIGSLQKWFGDNRVAPEIDSIKSAIERKLEPPCEKMSPSERVHVKATMMVIQHLGDLVPEAGAGAWDYCNVLALARMAFACDLLSNTEFMQTALFFTDECKNKFSSWDEFTRSAVVGGFYNIMCFDTQYDIKAATLFANAAGSLCKKNYPKVTWIV